MGFAYDREKNYETEIIKRNDEFRNKFAHEVNKLDFSDPSGIIEEFKRVCSEVDTSSLSDKYNKMTMVLKGEINYE